MFICRLPCNVNYKKFQNLNHSKGKYKIIQKIMPYGLKSPGVLKLFLPFGNALHSPFGPFPFPAKRQPDFSRYRQAVATVEGITGVQC